VRARSRWDKEKIDMRRLQLKAKKKPKNIRGTNHSANVATRGEGLMRKKQLLRVALRLWELKHGQSQWG
jgi:hypothetical protein